MADGTKTGLSGFEWDAKREERFDEAVRAGMERGQTERIARRHRMRRRFALASSVALLLFTCLFTLRVSPVFASMVRQIPGMEAFVDLMRSDVGNDRTLGLAIDNDLVQPVGLFDEHHGVKFTVEGIIADEQRFVVLYSIKGFKDKGDRINHYPYFESITDFYGRELRAAVSSAYPYEETRAEKDAENHVRHGTIDIRLGLEEERLPEEAILTVKLPTDQGDFPFRVRFPIDHAKFAGMRQEYALNETVVAEGQRITFEKAIVRPLGIEVHVAYGESNTQQVFDPGDIRLVDEKGEEWRSTSGSGTLDVNRDILHFESNYFHAPKELYIEGSWFRALDKDNMEIVIDTDSGQLLKAPDDQLKLESVRRSDQGTEIVMKMNVWPEDHMGYSVLELAFRDAAGREFEQGDVQGTKIESHLGDDLNEQTSYYLVKAGPYTQPLTFTVSQYPQYVRQPYKIRIR